MGHQAAAGAGIRRGGTADVTAACLAWRAECEHARELANAAASLDATGRPELPAPGQCI